MYWYNACGQVEDFYQNCYGANMVCQYGQCVYQQYINPAPNPNPNPNPYNPYATTACYGSNVYWYDSLGVASGLYKSCADANSCTQDACSAGKCSNVLKCDGTTCSAESADYKSYCQPVKPEPGPNGIEGLSVSFFAKQDLSAIQWEKSVRVGQSGQVYFLVSVANNGRSPIDNVVVSASIPSEVGLLGNIQVDNSPVAGDIASGINIGSLAPMSAKVVNFEGKTQTFSDESAKQAKVSAIVGQAKQEDSLSINFVPGQVAGASTSSSGFWDFVKRWYVWILVGAVLIFLFFVVFRRLSSNNA